MAVILRNSNKGSSQVDKKTISILGTEIVKDIYLPRVTYQYLGSLVKNKDIVALVKDEKIPIEYKSFLENFEKLGAGEDVDSYYNKLDEYLGSLGIDEEYSYAKDYRGIPAWIYLAKLEPFRNIVTMNNKVSEYNIVYNDGTTTFNVVHNTGA